jgi:hypothetical protein
MTMTSNMSTRLLCLKVGEPAQGSQPGHKAIFTAARDDKLWEAVAQELTDPAEIYAAGWRQAVDHEKSQP